MTFRLVRARCGARRPGARRRRPRGGGAAQAQHRQDEDHGVGPVLGRLHGQPAGYAYSATFKGVGVFAGGPYMCAGHSNYTACMYNATISAAMLSTMQTDINNWAATLIDNKANVAGAEDLHVRRHQRHHRRARTR